MVELVHQFMDMSRDNQLVIGSIILFLAIAQAIIFRFRRLEVMLAALIVIHVLLAIFLQITTSYSWMQHLFYAIPSIPLAMIFQVFDFSFKRKKKDPLWTLTIPTNQGRNLILHNIKRGISIFGAAGAGKTESGFVPIIKHMAERNFAGINYDYKDGELTEITDYFYRDNDVVANYVVAPARPEISHRLNPIAPEFIPSQETVNELVKVFFANASGKTSGNAGGNFFQQVPEATLAAVIWRLRCDYPEYCTLPHAISVCLVKDPKELAAFLEKNEECKIMAAPYFDSMAGADQLAGVKGSLSNEMRKFAFPSVFYILTGNEVDLRLNDPSSLGLLNVMNKPGLDETYSPFISVIISSALNCMRERGKSHSLLLMDEGPTVTLNKLSRVPATLRSYNIGTVYSMQDKVLGSEQQGDITTRAVLANLSYQLIGKANDGETIRYYKQLFAEVEKTTRSRSYDSRALLGSSRISENKRTTGKYLNQDFSGLKTGEFLFLSDGEDRKTNISLTHYERNELKTRHTITEDVLRSHYHMVIQQAKGLS